MSDQLDCIEINNFWSLVNLKIETNSHENKLIDFLYTDFFNYSDIKSFYQFIQLVEKNFIEMALNESNLNMYQTSVKLGITFESLLYRVEVLDINTFWNNTCAFFPCMVICYYCDQLGIDD